MKVIFGDSCWSKMVGRWLVIKVVVGGSGQQWLGGYGKQVVLDSGWEEWVVVDNEGGCGRQVVVNIDWVVGSGGSGVDSGSGYKW